MLLRPLVGTAFIFFTLITSAETPDNFSLPPGNKNQTRIDEGPKKLLNNFEVSEPQFEDPKNVLREKKNSSLYGFRQSFSGHLGITQDDGTKNIYGFNYLLPSETNHSWEAGIDVYSGGAGAFSFGYRYIFFHLSRIRPFVKAAAGFKSDGSGQLGSLVEFGNLRGTVSVGFEHLLITPFSYRIEAGASQSSSESSMELKAGISWGWY